MKLLVSIHDVSPVHAGAVVELWNMCVEREITPALFVVPNWHGAWPLREFPEFVAWLHRCAATGAEIVLHGDRHDEHGTERTFLDRLRAFGVTENEGEFLSLNADEARARIARGLEALRACGLEPTGFVPPAWLGSRGWSRTVQSFGLHFSEDAASIHLHDRATRLATPVTRWSTRTGARAIVSAFVADVRWRREPRAPLMRIALHPQDLSSSRVRASIARTLTRWLVHHHAWQYATL